MKKSFYLILILTTVFFSCNSNKEDTRPNILFIMSDDHAYQAISSYGYNLNNTPNIDRIAKEGAIFKNSFVTNSICAPSRAVMLTGKHSFLNGKVDNIQDFNWDQNSFAKELKKSGYQTALIGKIHLRGLPQGFDYSAVLPGQGHYYNPDFIIDGVMERIQGYVTTITTNLSLDWLKNKREKNKPFLLLYHQKAPHRNWQSEEKYLTLFDDKTFDFPSNFFDDYKGRKAAAAQEMMISASEDQLAKTHGPGGHGRWGHDFKLLTDPYGRDTRFNQELERFTPEQKKAWLDAYTPKNDAMRNANLKDKDLALWKFNRYLKDYLRTIQSVDDGVGEVLNYLDEAGLSDNTIVVYTSDQGFYLGEHGWFDKRFMYEESLKTPFLIRYPKEIPAGSQVNELIQNLDYAPTFLDYANVKIPEDMQGESFRKIVSNETEEWRDAIYYTYYEYPSVHMVKRHYGIRTDRYKLIHFYYDIDEWELFDLKNDPNEMNNIYDDPKYSEIKEQMHKKLSELRVKYGDSKEMDQKNLDRYLGAIKDGKVWGIKKWDK